MSEISPFEWEHLTPAPLVGVDEVGRGCLAGPVCAGAVVLRQTHNLEKFTDSKLISEKRRPAVAQLIWDEHWVGLGSASVEEIDELNILQASLLAMHRAVLDLEQRMGLQSGHLLIDGNQRLPDWQGAQTTVVQGDLRCKPISAASIVAKVHRDQLMQKMALEYPQYGFEKHKGYGSEFHRGRIREFGPTQLHRRSFRGVKEFLSVGSRR